tara:strand:+ start:46 stop:654 length:609 start_codon:yes stop_codon:yes gene_type:complete
MNNKLDLIKIINTILNFLDKDLDFEKSQDLTFRDLKLSQTQIRIINEELLDNGIESLIVLISNVINEKMTKKKPKSFINFRVNEKIKFLVLQRLKIIDKYFEKKQILKLVLKQKSLSKINKMLFNISDEVWFVSGDSSTDFNYYTKRFILMNIYVSTFLYFLRDSSEDFSKTENLLDKQIKAVLKFGKLKSKIMNIFYSNKM